MGTALTIQLAPTIGQLAFHRCKDPASAPASSPPCVAFLRRSAPHDTRIDILICISGFVSAGLAFILRRRHGGINNWFEA
eukprot:1691606-Pyramimonas_sp.AAC.1